jgi:two-component system, NarL family, nitrate/nitrite response regulator NarL
VVVLGSTPQSADDIRTFVQEDLGTRTIVLTATAEPAALLRALTAGANSCIMHGHFEPHELADLVVATARGECVLSPPVVNALVGWLNGGGGTQHPEHRRGLTAREMEIMELISMGLNNRCIAGRLAISEKTVKNHVHSIYKRLGANGRDHAVECWRELTSE